MRILGRQRGYDLLLVMLALTACDARPPLVEVTGVVVLDGEPMADVLVAFLPDPEQDTHGPRCSGITDAQGRFQLMCDDERKGAVVGLHRVLVQDVRTFPPPRSRHKDESPPVMPPSRVSGRYENASVTPLRQRVTAGPQTITIQVTSK